MRRTGLGKCVTVNIVPMIKVEFASEAKLAHWTVIQSKKSLYGTYRHQVNHMEKGRGPKM